METDVKEQLISTIMKTFAYTRSQADYLFIQLINCVSNKDLVKFGYLKEKKGRENLNSKLFIKLDIHLQTR